MARLFDTLLSAVVLLLLAPILGIVALLVWREFGRPILFVQKRTGKDGKIFDMYKFRSMHNTLDAEGNLLPDAERTPAFGRKLRSTSLDELPELINVLKGEMSLVGPRPLLPQYLPLYSKRQFRRHEVRPGITGWAQVNGRNAISWEEKFELDVEYVERKSVLFDIKVLAKTVAVVLNRSGVSSSADVNMPPFAGTPGETPHDQS